MTAVPRARAATALVVASIAALGLGACGPDEADTVLSVQTATRVGDQVVVTTECASDVRLDARPDPAGSGLVELTVRGTPELGRCAPELRTDAVPVDQVKVVDAATSQAVDIELDR